ATLARCLPRSNHLTRTQLHWHTGDCLLRGSLLGAFRRRISCRCHLCSGSGGDILTIRPSLSALFTPCCPEPALRVAGVSLRQRMQSRWRSLASRGYTSTLALGTMTNSFYETRFDSA